MATTTRRTSFTIPKTLNDDLTYMSSKLGVSKSAIVTELLTEPLANLSKILSSIPDNPTDTDLKRFRGQSIGYIQSAIGDLNLTLDTDLRGAQK